MGQVWHLLYDLLNHFAETFEQRVVVKSGQIEIHLNVLIFITFHFFNQRLPDIAKSLVLIIIW